MNLVRSLSPSFSMSLAGTVLCVLVVTTPTYGQTQATAKAADSPPQWAYPENNSNYKPSVDDGKPVRVPNSTAGLYLDAAPDPIHRAGLAPGGPWATTGYRS